MMKDRLETSSILKEYKKTVIPMLSLALPRLNIKEISDAVDYSILKRANDTPVVLDNNYRDKQMDTSLMMMADYIMERKPIMSAYGVLFKDPSAGINPIANLVTRFMEDREIFKGKMFEHDPGSYLYGKYNLLQLLSKIDANALN